MTTEQSLLSLHSYQKLAVYIDYDRPVLYSCMDSNGQRYLVVLADEAFESESWLCVPVSDNRLRSVTNGDLDLYTAFSVPENRYAFLVTEHSRQHEPSVRAMPIGEIGDDLLPVPGVSLVRRNLTPIRVGNAEVYRPAMATTTGTREANLTVGGQYPITAIHRPLYNLRLSPAG